MKLKNRHWLLFIGLMFLLTACGLNRDRWAGITPTEEDLIIVSYERFVAQVNPQSNEVIWRYPAADQRDVEFFASPVYDDEVVYVGDYSGGVHAIDRETGEGIWKFEQGGTKLFGFLNFGGAPDRIIGPVAIGESLIFVPNENGVFALEKDTGQRVDDWLLHTDRAVWSQPVYLPEKEALFVTSLNHHLYRVDPLTSEIIWDRDLGGAAPGRPLYHEEYNLLFVSTFASEVLAVDADTGDIIQNYETEGWVWEPPAFSEDGTTLYLADVDGYLYAVEYDAEGEEFSELWRTQITAEGKFRAMPLITDNLVIIGSDDANVYGVRRRTGELEWQQETERKVLSDLIEIPGEEEQLVVTATDDSGKLLIGLRLDNGNERWTYAHKDE